MSPHFHIRDFLQEDTPSLKDLYMASFPDESLLPLVHSLLNGKYDVVSLSGLINGSLVAHIVFTICRVKNSPDKIALLGPVCVQPDQQRKGYGGQMIRAGFEQLKKDNIPTVCVLGDPDYYKRFGFHPETCVNPPYPLPGEWRDAWRSASLNGNKRPPAGVLDVPEPWRRPELWA